MAWNHQQVRSGLISNGWWALRAAAEELINQPSAAGLQKQIPRSAQAWKLPGHSRDQCDQVIGWEALPITNARIKIGDFDQIRPVKDSDTEITFKVTLAPGDTRLQTWFTGKNDLSLCAYYVYIEKD